MKVYAALDARLPLSGVPALAARLEGIGFDGIHVPETIHDSFAVALLAAEHTERITIRTAVSLAFVRSPTLVAYTAWDLATFSGGRFELGLGTQIRQNIEDRFGMPWGDPVARMEDYVATLGALFASFQTGDGVRHEGEHYRITRMQPYFNPGPADLTPPPIVLGAVNPRMCRVAGQVASGVVTHSTNSDPAYLRDVVAPALSEGASTAGRTTPPPIYVSSVLATGPDAATVREARERQRRMLAFLYSTPAYRPTLERNGWPELSGRLQALVRADAWHELPDVVTDEILDKLLVSGTYDELPTVLLERYGALASGVVMPVPPPTDDDGLGRALDRLRSG